ncbi:MAG: hypothetical protein ABJE95_10630 [Byssovorax sp.]
MLVVALSANSLADDPYDSNPPATAPKKAGGDEPEWKVKQRRLALFDEGKKLLDEGHPAEALAKFREVQKLRAHPRVLLLMALAEDQLGHLLKAKAIYAQAEADAREAKLEDVRQDATKALVELVPKIPRVAVHPTPPTNVVVLIDQVRVTLDEGIVEVEAGKHTVVVSASERTSYFVEIDIHPGEEKIVEAVLPPLPPPPPSVPPGGACAGCAMSGRGADGALSVALSALTMFLARRARRR